MNIDNNVHLKWMRRAIDLALLGKGRTSPNPLVGAVILNKDGELISGPHISRHWVECSFMWPYKKMPDPAGGKRLLDYDCQVSYEKTSILKPRIIKKPDDFRTGTKKGKLDKIPVWHVNIKMPKKLLVDILGIDSDMQNTRRKFKKV